MSPALEVLMYFLGVDTGGTFTDFALYQCATRHLLSFKVRSVPDDPVSAVEAGLERLRDEMGVDLGTIERFIFGTTVATNAVLENKGARTALLTTAGMRDVLEIQRQWRQRLFDLYLEKPPPLVPRRYRFEVEERIKADGEVLLPLTESEVDRVIGWLAEAPIEVVAISLLFSFVRPDHEQRLAEAIRERLPHLRVTTSCEVCPEFREYERTATTVIERLHHPEARWTFFSLRRRAG